jgi:hypothetical protein
MIDVNEEDIEKACKELVDMAPAPMNTMLQKQPRDEAVKKKLARKAMVVVNVPPTAGTLIFISVTVLK